MGLLKHELKQGDGDKFLASLRPYVSPPALLPPSVAEGAPEILPGIVVAVAIDTGSQVNFFPQSSMIEMVRTVASQSVQQAPELFRQIAIQNLRKLPLPNIEKFQSSPGRSDGDVFLLEMQDSFVASRITFLDELAEWVSPGQPRTFGVLLAIPRRRTVLLHIPSGPAILSALDLMGKTAVGIFQATPQSKISPYVFYVSPDARTQIVVLPDKNGGIVVQTAGVIGEFLYGPSGLLMGS